MTNNARVQSSLDDITWSDFTDAGLDTDLITRKLDDEYVWMSPDKTLQIAIGPAMDVESRTTFGWDAMTYSWDEDIEDWRENSQEGPFDTAAEVLAWMARRAAA